MSKFGSQFARGSLTALAGLVALLAAADLADGQTRPTRTRANPETTPAQRRPETDPATQPVTPDRPTLSTFGHGLSEREAAALLVEARQLTEQALAASRAAEQASSVAEVKAAAARVAESVWGIPAGVGPDGSGPVDVLGWKERWQVTGAEFDPRWQQRYGTAAPRISDPRRLGIGGRTLALRNRFEQLAEFTSNAPASRRAAANNAMAAVSNVVGWMHVTKGYKGREVQPRISLTHVWDMPVDFWNSSADTGWLHEVYSQAVNILKTDYGTDVAEARRHAAAMTPLVQKVLAGVDADRNGAVEAKPMEGGLVAALGAAAQAGFQAQ